MTDLVYKPQQEKIFSESTTSVLFDKSRQKSSRSKADLFELLIIKNLANYFKVPFKYESDIKTILLKIASFRDGTERIKEQNYRAKLLFPAIIKEIKKLFLTLGRPTKITWIGRKWQTSKSLSDIKINFSSGKILNISIKSTRSGKGTQKNIGLKELKKYLGLDIDKELQDMKNKIISKIADQNIKLKEIAKKGMAAIKANKYKFPIIQVIGKEFGIPLQSLAVKESVKCFNSLNIDKKKEFLNFIFGLSDDELLLNAFISGEKHYIYWNKNLGDLISRDIKAVSEGNKGYYIFSNGKNIVRIQVNFTNGIGISAFCERAFL